LLVLTAGKFGERWVDLAKAFGCHVDVVKAPYGQTFESGRNQEGAEAGASRRLFAGHGDLDRGAATTWKRLPNC
jgi:aspartate aminotransferase-like enzyme